MAQVERNSADTLAIHQQMLAQEEFQNSIEEFLYNSDKLLDLFQQDLESGQRELSLVSIYWALRNIADSVAKCGIDTSAIRGRENKAAFESLMGTTKGLIASLEKGDKTVQVAIAEAKARQEQQEKAERQAEAERTKRQQKIESELAVLRSQRQTLTSWGWYSHVVGKRIDALFTDGSPATAAVIGFIRLVIHAALWLGYGFAWIPVLFLIRRQGAASFSAWYAETVTKRINSVVRSTGTAAGSIAKALSIFPGSIVLFPLCLLTYNQAQKEVNAEVDQRITALEADLRNFKSPFRETEFYVQRGSI